MVLAVAVVPLVQMLGVLVQQAKETRAVQRPHLLQTLALALVVALVLWAEMDRGLVVVLVELVCLIPSADHLSHMQVAVVGLDRDRAVVALAALVEVVLAVQTHHLRKRALLAQPIQAVVLVGLIRHQEWLPDQTAALGLSSSVMQALSAEVAAL